MFWANGARNGCVSCEEAETYTEIHLHEKTSQACGFELQGFIITPIFHPNISKTGEICVNTLK
jgi:hypothetical protein